jgi:hypothetical protein
VTISGSPVGFEGRSLTFGSTVSQPPGVNDVLTYEWQLLDPNGTSIQVVNGTTGTVAYQSENDTVTVADWYTKFGEPDAAIPVVFAAACPSPLVAGTVYWLDYQTHSDGDATYQVFADSELATPVTGFDSATGSCRTVSESTLVVPGSLTADPDHPYQLKL